MFGRLFRLVASGTLLIGFCGAQCPPVNTDRRYVATENGYYSYNPSHVLQIPDPQLYGQLGNSSVYIANKDFQLLWNVNNSNYKYMGFRMSGGIKDYWGGEQKLKITAITGLHQYNVPFTDLPIELTDAEKARRIVLFDGTVEWPEYHYVFPDEFIYLQLDSKWTPRFLYIPFDQVTNLCGPTLFEIETDFIPGKNAWPRLDFVDAFPYEYKPDDDTLKHRVNLGPTIEVFPRCFGTRSRGPILAHNYQIGKSMVLCDDVFQFPGDVTFLVMYNTPSARQTPVPVLDCEINTDFTILAHSVNEYPTLAKIADLSCLIPDGMELDSSLTLELELITYSTYYGEHIYSGKHYFTQLPPYRPNGYDIDSSINPINPRTGPEVKRQFFPVVTLLPDRSE